MDRILRVARRAARRVQRLAAALEPPGARDDAALERCERPVLLLPGGPGGRRSFDVLERRLRRDGYGVFAVDLGGLRTWAPWRGVDDVAELVRVAIDRLRARRPRLAPLSIVGHASGGLVAAYYVKKLGGWRRTRAVVTLGAPHRGTPLGWLGRPLGPAGRALSQQAPGSPFLARLGDGPWPSQVRLASIWSRRDGLAPWPACVIETHGLPQLANVEVDADHRELLTRKRVYEAILRELRSAERDAPVVRGRLAGMRGGRARRPGPAAPLGAEGSSGGAA